MGEAVLDIVEIARKHKIPVTLAVRWAVLENEANLLAAEIVDIVGLEKFIEFGVEFASMSTLPLSSEEKEMYLKRFGAYYEQLKNWQNRGKEE